MKLFLSLIPSWVHANSPHNTHCVLQSNAECCRCRTLWRRHLMTTSLRWSRCSEVSSSVFPASSTCSDIALHRYAAWCYRWTEQRWGWGEWRGGRGRWEGGEERGPPLFQHLLQSLIRWSIVSLYVVLVMKLCVCGPGDVCGLSVCGLCSVVQWRSQWVVTRAFQFRWTARRGFSSRESSTLHTRTALRCWPDTRLVSTTVIISISIRVVRLRYLTQACSLNHVD